MASSCPASLDSFMSSLCYGYGRSFSTKSQAEKLRDNFFLTISCPVCLRYFDEPINLPGCEHTLCRQCLKSIIENKKRQRLESSLYEDDDTEDEDSFENRYRQDVTIDCPVCRTINYISCPELKGLRQNSVVRQIVEMVHAHEQRTGLKRGDGDWEPTSSRPVDGEKKDKEKEVTSPAADSCCHFLFPGMSTKVCPHCSNNFCEPCLFFHLEQMKLKIGNVRAKWNEARIGEAMNDLDRAYSEFASDLNEQVRGIEVAAYELADSVLAKAKECLYEQVQRLVATADSLRTDLLDTVGRSISQGQKFEQQLFNDRVDRFLRSSVLEAKPSEVVDLFKLANEREGELAELEMLNKFTNPEFITFAMEPDAAEQIEFFIKDGELKIGEVHIGIKGRLPRKPDGPSAASLNPGQPTDTAESGLTAEVIDSFPFTEVDIVKPIAITSLPGSKFVLITHNQTTATALRFLDRKLIDVGSIVIHDPDQAASAKNLIAFGEEMVADKSKVFFLDSKRKRLIAFLVPWTQLACKPSVLDQTFKRSCISLFGAKVKARNNNGFSGLAINLDRHELYTIVDGTQLLAFCTVDNLLHVPKFKCPIAPTACLLSANDDFGIIYGVRSEGRHLWHKFWVDDKPPSLVELDEIQLQGVSEDDAPMGFGGGADVDSFGNIYIADFIGSCIRIYFKEDCLDKLPSGCYRIGRCIKIDRAVTQRTLPENSPENAGVFCRFDPIKPYGIAVISKTSARPGSPLQAVVIDAASRNIIVLNFLEK